MILKPADCYLRSHPETEWDTSKAVALANKYDDFLQTFFWQLIRLLRTCYVQDWLHSA